MSQSPLDVVHAFLKAMETLDYDTALPYIADTCEYENMPMGKVHGPAGVRSVLEPFFAPTLENEFKILRELAQGPLVFAERLDRHRIAKGWVELPVTGVFEVHDGKITLWRDYFDAATITSKWPTA
ncbi:limonene-1,2-epoxide hydrolase family protein [Phenylobacterium aquaticum]|jgi:limonene-1,2-epoxide hydrolase|uniref:limonene-1,2-epoxide hydrolase family protein n=1 Tax=Phenylobacterium aquaticum TaxID=1763816 RepID=UPI001F5DC8F5|nr:limonene-1,2-epoxide hydrolase family protein [Phenylobacterium aquaticum]MCI3131395.1 nuclear transport factor 2 family protein [Phenylobacterium aquaticum]